MKSVRRYLLIYFFVLGGSALFAQQSITGALAENEKAIDSFYQKGNFVEALPIAKKSYSLVKKHYAPTDSIYIAHLGVYNYFLSKNGHYETAEPSMQKELRLIAQRFGQNSLSYGMSLNNLAAMYTHTARLSEAEPLMLESLEVWRHLLGKEHRYYVISLNNYASLLADLGKHQEAEKRYYECAQLYRKIVGEDHLKYASALNNLAQLYGKQQKYIAAEPLHRKVLAIYEQNNMTEHPEYASALINLATVLKLHHKQEEAEKLYKKALRIKEKTLGRFHPAYLDGLNSLGGFYVSQHRLEKATATIREALGINALQSISLPLDHPVFFDSLQTIDFNYPGIALTSVGQLLEVFELRHKATGNKRWVEHSARGAMAANRLLIDHQHSFANEDDRIQLLSKAPTFAEQGISSLLQLSTTASPDKVQHTFLFSEQSKSAALSLMLRSKFALHFGGIPNQLIKEQRRLNIKKNKIQSQLFNEGEQSLELIRQLNTIDTELSAFRKRLEKDYPKYYQLKHAPSQTTLPEVQKQLAAKTALVQYFIGKKESVVLVITNKEAILLPLETNSGQLTQRLRVFRQCLTDYNFIIEQQQLAYNNFCEGSNQLYQLLFQAVEQELPANTEKLIIIPDHVLNYLPFEVLISQAPTNHNINYRKLNYLLNHYDVSYDYSANLWLDNDQKLVTQNSKLLAMAAIYHGNKNTKPIVRGPWVKKVRGVLQDIPLARKEVEELQNHFIGTFYSGKTATEDQFKKEAPTYGIIHLALHGMTNSNEPIQSGLLFSDSDTPYDNLLQVHEIGNLDLKANLVVLSACESGFGQIKDGEGVISIARSFIYAGASSLTISLWQINDASTATLMKIFYEQLAKGKSKSKALRLAKQNYLKSSTGVASHPAYWAAFIQLGNDHPISIQQKARQHYFFGLIASLLVVSGILMFFYVKRSLIKEK